MKTFVLTLDDTQEEVIQALAKALKLDMVELSQEAEDQSLMVAMEDGKKYGRLSEAETDAFLKKLGK